MSADPYDHMTQGCPPRELKSSRSDSTPLQVVESSLHHQRLFLFTLILVGYMSIDASAQSVSLSLPSVEAVVGSSATLPMLVTNDHEIDAVSIGVHHRSSNIAVTNVTQGSALTSLNEPGSQIPAFFNVQLAPTLPNSDPTIVGGFTVGILVDLDLGQPTRIPVGADAELLIVTYNLNAATIPESVPIEFSDLLGTPRVVLLAVVNDLVGTPPTEVEVPVEVTPTVTHGQINITNSPFLRGDVNGSGALSLLDGILYLYRRFGLQPPGTCDAAEDINGDGQRTLLDAMYFFQFLFGSGPQPPAPFPNCAAGTASDQTLGCSNSGVCQ